MFPTEVRTESDVLEKYFRFRFRRRRRRSIG